MGFNTVYHEQLKDLESLELIKKQKKHPIGALLDYGYDVTGPNMIMDPDGNEHHIPDLYDLIVRYKKENL